MGGELMTTEISGSFDGTNLVPRRAFLKGVLAGGGLLAAGGTLSAAELLVNGSDAMKPAFRGPNVVLIRLAAARGAGKPSIRSPPTARSSAANSSGAARCSETWRSLKSKG